MKAALRVGAATAVFGIIHSLLASDRAKELAARVVGERERNGGYRLFYNAQAVVTLALLLGHVSRVPRRTVYRMTGAAVWPLRAGQASGLALAYLAAREVGVLKMTGFADLYAYVRRQPLDPGPAAQGPERLASGDLSSGGPFRWSRHPLNLAPLPVFWLTPHLTTRRLAFNVVATAYLVLGSLHEERRLRARYGSDYETYQRSGVPFFLPRRALPIHAREQRRPVAAPAGKVVGATSPRAEESV